MGPVLERRLSAAALDDATLMAALADPESAQAAMALLYRRFERPLLAYARRRLDDRMRAEELVQETMTRVWRMAPRYDSAKGTVECVVYTIASRVLVDILRRNQRTLPTVAAESGLERTVDDQTSYRELCLMVRDALRSLSDDHRTVIELAYFGGFTQTQIADRLGIPLGTVKTRSYWALRALHDVLGRSAYGT